MIKRTAACLSVLVASASLAAAAEYTPTAETYLLMHFNGDLAVGAQTNATAALFGDARLTPDGWQGGALEPGAGGGVLVRTDRPFNPPYGPATLEARVLLRAYPTNRAYVIDKVFQVDNPHVHNNTPTNGALGLSLFVDAKGRIGNEITSLYYGPDHKVTFWSPDGVQVPTGRWVHVAVVNAGWPVGKYKMYVDGRPILDVPHEFTHRTFYNSERESACGQVVVGNNSRHTAPFTGLIDEVRILGANLDLNPPADISWVDAPARRPLVQGPPAFLPDTHPLLYLSCDDTNAPPTNATGRVAVRVTGGHAAPGVRGSALSGATIELSASPLLSGKEGTIEFWMMPENWNNRMVQNFSFLSSSPEPYLTWYVFNDVHELRALTLYFMNDENKLVFIGFEKFIDEQNWHHFLLSWKDGAFTLYLNGRLMAQAAPKDITKFVNGVRTALAFIGGHEDKTTRFDEIYLYAKALSPDEVWNAYARYRDPAKLRAATPYGIRFKQYPALREVHAEIDFREGRRPDRVQVALIQQGRRSEGAPLSVSTNLPGANAVASTRALAAGDFTAELQLRDAAGAAFLTVTQACVRKDYSWLGNALGVPATVPDPWLPLKVQGATVRSLLTEYDLSQGLIGQITTDGEPLLASPIVLEAAVAQAPLVLRGRKAQATVLGKGLGVNLTQTLRGGGVTVECFGTLEFDGFIKYVLRISADRRDVALDSLRLRIPFRADQALDYYVLGEHMDHMAAPVPAAAGPCWDSRTGKLFVRGELPEYGAMARPKKSLACGSFLPFAWAGNNHRGLCYLADNDRGWVRSATRAALEISRTADTVYLDLNLIAAPVTLAKGHPREIVLALMATPSKRPAQGWRHWSTDSFYTISAAGRVLGSDMFYVPYPADYAKSGAYLKPGGPMIHLPYMDFYGSDTRMEPAEDFRWEWWPSLADDEFPRRSAVYPANYCSGSLIDWYISNFSRWVDTSGVNGLYIDNIYPSPLAEAVVGPGYVDERGQVQPGYELFAMRDWLKRVYCLMAAKGRPHPYTMPHMTHCLIAPVLSFADIAYEGEDHYINGEAARPVDDHIAYWPNEIVRIIDLPHAWGVGTHWLTAVQGAANKWKLPFPREYYVRAWYTQLLLHDMRGGVGDDGGAMAAFDRFLDKDPAVEFVLYRDNRAIRAEPAADVFVSYYRRPGKVLAVIGNQAREDRTLKLAVDLQALGFAQAAFTDGETGVPVSGAAGALDLQVPKRNYRLLLITGQP